MHIRPVLEKEIRILMLEDIPADAELNREELLKAGVAFQTRRVGTKEEFILGLEEFRPDLVLADYALPGYDGLSAIRLVHEKYPTLPIVIVTGALDEETAAETIKAGAADYVLKGRLARLGPAVLNALERKREHEEKERAQDALRDAYAELELKVRERTRELSRANEALRLEIEERRRAEHALEYRLEFEKTIGTLAADFIGVRTVDLDREIGRALALLGSFAGVDRSYIFLFRDDMKRMDNTYEWVASGVDSQKGELQGLSTSGFPWFMGFMCRREICYVPDVEGLPPEARAERAIFESGHVRSLVNVPMVYGEDVVGFLGFDSVRGRKSWSADIINLLNVTSTMFINALERKWSEEVVRESEKRYRAIFENTGAATVIIENDTMVSLVNAEFEKLTGYAKEEIEGKVSWRYFIDPGETAKMMEYHRLRRINRNAAPKRYESKLVTRSGDVRNVIIAVDVIPESKRSVASFIDITDRKKAEGSLRESEERFRTAAEFTYDMEYWISPANELIFMSPSCERITGYSPGEFAGAPGLFNEIMHPDDRARIESLLRGATERRETVSVDFRILRKDGETRWIGHVSQPVQSAAGRYLGRRASNRDITGSKVFEQRLRRERDRAQQYLDVAGVAMVVIGRDERVRLINDKGCLILGYCEEEVVGQNWFETFVPERMRGTVRGYFANAIHGAAQLPIDYETPVLTKSGEERIVWWHSAVIHDEAGRVSGTISSGEDITERKRTQEKLRESYLRLQKAIDGVINAMAKIVEVRDPYTAGHEQRVSVLALAIAREMGFSEERLEAVKLASLIYDVGKVYVPGEILNKPGNLSPVEMDIVKIHPTASYDILKVIEFPWPVAQIAFQHQERYDGSGYPAGLKGEDILLEARLLTVADVIEAMTSHRPYRSVMSVDEALAEIVKNRGILYDPLVVDATLRVFKEKGFKFGA